MPRIIRVAWIRTAHMRAERTPAARRILVERELILLPNLIWRRCYSWNGFFLKRH